MDKKIFQEHTDEQRLSLLKDNASCLLEDYGYNKPLTEAQVKDLKNKIANCVSELRKEKLNKSAAMKAYTERITLFGIRRRELSGTAKSIHKHTITYGNRQDI